MTSKCIYFCYNIADFAVVQCVVSGPIEADPEYQLIVEANNITVEIDNEISELFEF